MFVRRSSSTALGIAREYLDLVDIYPAQTSAVRGHLFKLFHHSFHVFDDMRQQLAKSHDLSGLRQVVDDLEKICKPLHDQYLLDPKSWTGELMLPHWLCQPYYRPSEESPGPVNIALNKELARKRKHELLDTMMEKTGISKNRLKRLEKRARNFEKILDGTIENIDEVVQKIRQTRQYLFCKCGNPSSGKCALQRCRKCCKVEAKKKEKNCQGHNVWHGDKNEFLTYMESRNHADENQRTEDAT